MEKIECPACGREIVPGAACPGCGHASVNGVARPAPPPEIAGWVITPVPPEMAEEFRRTFNEEEYLAAVREMERTGGHRLEDFIDEIERIAHGKE
jgi:uncharacterized OB-fold protein